jgi:hypothetical protein
LMSELVGNEERGTRNAEVGGLNAECGMRNAELGEGESQISNFKSQNVVGAAKHEGTNLQHEAAVLKFKQIERGF